MIDAKDVKDIEISYFTAMRLWLYLWFLDTFIKLNAKKGKRYIIYNENILLFVLFRKYDIPFINNYMEKSGYNIILMNKKAGVSWE